MNGTLIALLVMETMKMEHSIIAPSDGAVTEFYFQPGDLVDVKSGYGRNFLIPSGKAIRADENNKAEYIKIVKSAKRKANLFNNDICDKTYQYLIMRFNNKIYEKNNKPIYLSHLH